MTERSATIVFDVNETLSDLSPVADVFEAVGVSRTLADAWFASVLRDGFALTIAGGVASFEAIAANRARDLLGGAGLREGLDRAVSRVMTAFAQVPPHRDVASGMHLLHAEGHRLVTLSNGPSATADRLLRMAGVRELFSDLLSVDGHSPWKPAPSSYRDAVSRLGNPASVHLAAVHPWDVHGASMAGLSTIWINRAGRGYPAHFRPATITVGGIGEIAGRL